MTLDDLLARLEGVRASGKGHIALCPAHDDKRHSLSVRISKTGWINLKCFAGCQEPAILLALGLAKRDLAPPKLPKAEKKIVAAYDYCDEAGMVLYQVVRHDPKDFRQRTPDGAGGWAWSLKGVRRVLYRLPELAKAP